MAQNTKQDPKEFDFVAKLLLKNMQKARNQNKESSKKDEEKKEIASIEEEMNKVYQN